MLEQMGRYDPKIYGELRAEYLNNLDRALFHPFVSTEDEVEDQEKRRQELMKEIKEGSLGISGH
jgi:hypothetical protein